MFLAYFLVFLSLKAWTQPNSNIQVLQEADSLEDFEHQNKGCPENSKCDQVMGQQMKRWKDLVTKLKDPKMEDSKKVQSLERFRLQYGLPVEFYTTKKSQQGFKPLYFNSPCKEHNPKKEDERILKGSAFVKSVTADKAIVWREPVQMEVPTKELFWAQPVFVYFPKGVETYYLPLDDQPLFIKDKNLFVLREDNDFFYTLKISSKGDWSVANIDQTKLTQWEDKKDNVTCPADKTKTAPSLFGAAFCKTIWDEDTKKTVVVKMHQGCSL